MKKHVWAVFGVLLLLMPAFQLAAQGNPKPPEAGVMDMSIEEQKKLSRRSLEMWASTNTDKPEEVFAANYVNHQEPYAKGGVKPVDLEAWKDIVRTNHRAFSISRCRSFCRSRRTTLSHRVGGSRPSTPVNTLVILQRIGRWNGQASRSTGSRTARSSRVGSIGTSTASSRNSGS